MSAYLFSRTAAGNGAVPVCCDRDIGFWFIIHQCFLRGKVPEETCCEGCYSYFNTHRSLILNWIICHCGRMYCNKLNNGLFHDVVTQVVDRDVSTAYY